MPRAPYTRRKRALAFVFVSLLAASTWSPATVSAYTITVPAKTGALAAAVAKAPNGATLILRGGTHVNNLITTSKSLTIKNYPGETPVLTHPTRRPEYLYLRGGPVLIYGITFRMGVNAPTFDDSTGSAMTEVIAGGHDVEYAHCTFIGNRNASSRQHLLYVTAGAGKVTVRNSRFNFQGGHGSGVHAYKDPGSALIISSNVFKNFYDEPAVMINQSGSGKLVTKNTFYDSYIAVQHVKSGGTKVTYNTGYRVRHGLDVTSWTNLFATGNKWNP
jgi:hypothetical protein